MLENRKTNIMFRVMGAALIFSQIFLATIGTIYSQSVSKFILAFYLVRLTQYCLNTLFLTRLVQSNAMCVALIGYALMNFSSGGGYFMITTLVMMLDALVGACHFVVTHEQELKSYLNIKDIMFMPAHKYINEENVWRLTKPNALFDSSTDDDFQKL